MPSSHLFKMFTLRFIVIRLLPCLLLFNQTYSFVSNTDEDINLKMAGKELQTATLDKIIQVYVLANSSNKKCQIDSKEYLTALKNIQSIMYHNDITLEMARNELQTSILDKVILVYVLSNSSNKECRIASKEYSTALKNYEPWALKMLDASSKLPSGIASGNMADYGAYTQCVKISNAGPARNINGKHCMLSILPPETLVKKMLLTRGIAEKTYQDVRNVFLNKPFEWSICVPDACQPDDVFAHFEHTVDELFDGLNVTLQPDIHCSTWAEINEPYTHTEQIVLGFIGVLCVIVLISTAVDTYKQNKDIERGYEAFFSLVTNSKWLISKRKADEQLGCVDGVRVLSIVLVIIGHRFLMSIFFASFNGFEIAEWVLNYSSQTIIGGTVSVDSFLLISGVLICYHFLLSQEKFQKFNYMTYLLHHYLRLAPSFGFVILVISVFGHRFGMGPKWAQSSDGVVQPCRNYWWSALLNIQSYVNPSSVCLLQTWYLSIDMVNYALAPLLLFLLMRNARLGFVALGMVLLSVWLANFAQIMSNKWVVFGLLDQNLPTTTFFTHHYTQPHIRPSPYLIGIALGYLLYKQRERKLRLRPLAITIGWACSFAIIITVTLANRIFLDPDYVYNVAENAVFTGLHRSGWALALGWIVWACASGYGGPINTFLSSHTFMVFAKLTYAAFLIHMPFQFFDNGASKVPSYFSNVKLVHKGLGDVGVSFILGYFLTLFVECPVYRLSLYLFKRPNKVTPTKVMPR